MDATPVPKRSASNVNLPNALTALRILLVPALVRLLLEREWAAALGVFAAAGLTDALDGYLAKRWDQRTRLGEVLDPLADKLLVVSAVLLLARDGRLPLWLAAAVIGRDVIIVSGAMVFRVVAGRLEMAPTRVSKLNTFVQLGTVVLVLADGAGWSPARAWLSPAFGAVLTTTVASGVWYAVVWGARAAQVYRRPQT